MNWEDDVVRAMVEGACPYANVQLELLLRRLEACHGALPHLADAIREVARQEHVDE